MAIKKDNGLEQLKKTIRESITHRDYEHVVALAKRYKAYVTGDGADDLIKQYVRREDDEAFQQRLAITKIVTPYIASRIMAPMFKAGRTIATIDYQWEKSDKASEKRKKLMDALGSYYGDSSVESYLTDRMVELDSTDPNTFIVTELPGEYDPNKAGEKPEPYPFEVNSEEAVDYKFVNNRLQYLTVLNEKNKIKRYTIYVSEWAIVAQQITKDDYDKFLSDSESKGEVFFKDPEKKSADEIYIITEAKHGYKNVPAVRVGSRRDLTTRGRTRVPMMDSAECFFYKSIQSISEMDLTIILHAFAQKIQFDKVCPGDLANNIICIDGKAPGGKVCSVCKGSGWSEHKSAQDIMRFKFPKDPKDIFSLENMIAYKVPPSDILTFLKELNLQDYPELAVRAVYTSETFTTDTVAKTATENNIDMESVYDALKRFMDKFSNVYKHITMVIASYASVNDGFSVVHKFPKDLKMKTIAALMQDLTTANSSGAPSYIKKPIYRDISQKLYADKPDELLKIDVKERFFPFNGKTDADISTIMNGGLTTRFNLILFANFDLIFDELEEENSTGDVSFWKMEIKAQRDLLKKKVESLIVAIDDEQANQRANDFGAPRDEGAAGQGDSQDFEVGDEVTYNGEPVEIVSASVGANGGKYTIRLQDNSEMEVSGKDLIDASENAA